MLSFLERADTFNQYTNKDAIKNILAVLMILVVNADEKITVKEQKKVLGFFKSEFDMENEVTVDLFNSVKHNEESISSSLIELEKLFASDITAKAKVLQHLNSVIICDGCVDEEYAVFENIKSYLL